MDQPKTTFFRYFRSFLGYTFRLEIAKSLQPFADFYYNIGRMLAGFFLAIKLIDRTHPWVRSGAAPRPLDVLAYVCARAEWNKPWKLETVMVASITLLVGLGTFAATSMTLAGVIGATDAYASSMFATTTPGTDLALKYMSNGFGIPITGVPPATVDGVVAGFQKMMALYSMAMLVVAGFILLYIITSAIASTAHEGRFGGGSFNQVWAPIRLVVAIGLLVPLPMVSGFNGYNSGQFIVLKISEFGSGLANNLWIPFAQALTTRTDPLVLPAAVPAAGAVRGILVNEFCLSRYNGIVNAAGVSAPLVQRLVSDSGRNRIIYYNTDASDTNSYCGVVSYERAATTGMLAGMTTSGTFSFIGNDILVKINAAYAGMQTKVQLLADKLNGSTYIGLVGDLASTGNEANIRTALTTDFVNIVKDYQDEIALAISSAKTTSATAAADALSTQVQDAGWAGAPMWFNTIARMNAEIMGAARSIPSSSPPNFGVSSNATTSSPDLLAQNVIEGVNVLNRYMSNLEGMMVQQGISLTAGANTVAGVQTSSVAAGFGSPGALAAAAGELSGGLGSILSAIFSVAGGPFGYIGSGVNAQLSQSNPLAELAAIGDWILNKSIFLMTVAFGGAAVSAVVSAVAPAIGAAIGNISAGLATLLFIVGMMGFGIGLTLFYMLPLLPFMRFLVAIAGWLMNILEAVVAIPLIAVAHLVTKGEGISGDLARTAYFMIFSIFLRPALLIVGMVTALMMFSLSIGILNDLYKSAVIGFRSGATGEANGGLSTVMYTIIYCIFAYGLCNQCFKLIEVIPNRALTWISGQAAAEITQDETMYRSLGGNAHQIAFAPLADLGKSGAKNIGSFANSRQKAAMLANASRGASAAD